MVNAQIINIFCLKKFIFLEAKNLKIRYIFGQFSNIYNQFYDS